MKNIILDIFLLDEIFNILYYSIFLKYLYFNVIYL